MGKSGLSDIYMAAANALGRRPKIHLAKECDVYDASRSSEYRGMIVYHAYSAHTWKGLAGQGLSAGQHGESFHVLILHRSRFPGPNADKQLYREYFGEDWGESEARACCGFFQIGYDGYAFNGHCEPLNDAHGGDGPLAWSSNGSARLSRLEVELADLAVRAWCVNGPGQVVEIPDDVHLRVVNGPKDPAGSASE